MLETKLSLLFKEIADSELLAEKNRHKIVQLLEFEDHYLFKSLQIYEKDYLIREDISQFLRNAGHQFDLEEIGLFISLYDVDHDEKLNLHEFLNFLVPHSGVLNASKNPMKDSAIPNDFNREFASFIVMEINAVKKIQLSLKKLASDPSWSPSVGFSLIDIERSGSLDLTNLSKFFRNVHLSLDYDSVLALCRRLNRGITGKVSYNNFLSWFKEPVERRSLKQSAYEPLEIDTKNLIDRLGNYLRSKSPRKVINRSELQESGFRRSIDPLIHDRHAYKRYYDKHHRHPHPRQEPSGYVSKLAQSTHNFGVSQRALNLSAYDARPIQSDSKYRTEGTHWSPKSLDVPNKYELLRLVDRALERSNDNIEKAISQEHEERAFQSNLNRLVERALTQSSDNLAAVSGQKSPLINRMKRSYVVETAAKVGDRYSPKLKERIPNDISADDPIESLVQKTLQNAFQIRVRSAIQDRDSGARLSPESKRLLSLPEAIKVQI